MGVCIQETKMTEGGEAQMRQGIGLALRDSLHVGCRIPEELLDRAARFTPFFVYGGPPFGPPCTLCQPQEDCGVGKKA